ncbi:MAG: hypothetical protein MRZ79_13430 [Bacteroidia bacterium]|nr:hypothetical protein [Bacteroidia bacterium]
MSTTRTIIVILATLAIVIFNHNTSLLAQDTLSISPLKKSEYVAIPLEAHPSEPGINLLFLENSREFKLSYFDDNFQFLEDLVIPKGNSDFWDIDITGLLNYPDEIVLYATVGDMAAYDRRGPYMFSLDKLSKSLTAQKLMLENPSREKLFNAFCHNDKFFRFYLNKNENYIRLKVFDRAQKVQDIKMNIASKSLVKTLSRNSDAGIPAIDEDRVNTLSVNAKAVKLYTYPEELILSVDDQEGKQTHFWVVNLISWEAHEESYPYLLSAENGENILANCNSLIYDDYLYQAYVGWGHFTIEKIDMSQGISLGRLDFKDSKEIRSYLGGDLYKKVFKTSGPVVKKGDYEILSKLQKSVALSFYENDMGETYLTIGSHIYIDQRTQNAIAGAGAVLSMAGAIASGGGYVSVWGGNGYTIGFNPFSVFDYALDLAYLVGNDKFFYGETIIDIENMESLGAAPPENSFDKALNYYFANRLTSKGYGVCFFRWKDKTVLGYGRRKQYQFVAFSND